MTFEELCSRFEVKKRYSNRAQCICPAHADAHASLTITRGERGTLIHCHAGCQPEDILEAVGLKKQDLFDEDSAKKSVADWRSFLERRENRRIEATYDYHGLNGDYRFTKVRLEGKRMLCGILREGRFTYGLGGRSRKDLKAVYGNLRAIQGAISRGERVFYVEGEKDVNTLTRNGFVSLTAGGVNDWLPEFAELFRGANAVILADNDSPGQKLAQTVLGDLQGIAASARIITPMPTMPHGDISDYFVAGHSCDDFLELCKDVTNAHLEPQEEAVTKNMAVQTKDLAMAEVNNLVKKLQELDVYHCFPQNDRGLAQLFALVFADQTRYNPTARDYMIYDGARWTLDLESMAAKRNAKIFADAMIRYAVSLEIDDESKKRYLGFTSKLMNFSTRNNLIRDAQDQNCFSSEELDTNDAYFNCKNVTLDLSRLEPEIRSHNPNDLIGKVSGTYYDPTAKSTLWEKTLLEIFQGDAATIQYIQKVLGRALIADVSDEKFLIFHGASTRNGKSTICGVLSQVFGDYFVGLKAESLAAKRNQDSRQASPDLAKLHNVRLAIVPEPEKSMVLNVALIKSITGQDLLTARNLYQNEISFKPKCRILLNSNYLPKVTEPTIFQSDRVQVIPFSRHFTKEERNERLKEELRQELPGILNWLLEGLKLFRTEGMEPSETVKEATEQYKEDSDKILSFIRENLEECPGENVAAGTAYEKFNEWCRAGGYGVENKSSFFEALQVRGLFKKQGTVNKRTVRNVIPDYRFMEDGFVPVNNDSRLPFN